MESRAEVMHGDAIDLPSVGAARKGVLPVAFARIPIGAFVARLGDEGLDGHRASRSSRFEDRLHPRVRCELLTFHDPDGGEMAQQLCPFAHQRLALDDGVDLVKYLYIHAVNRIEDFARDVYEAHLGRIPGLRQRINLEAIFRLFHSCFVDPST